jgi:hypothetical protein
LGVGVQTNNLFFVDNGELVPCGIDTQRRSRYYEFISDSPLTFVRVVRAPDGEERRVPVAQVSLGSLVNQPLLIFTKSGPNDDLRILVIEDDITGVPPGSYRILNCLPINAGITAGVEKRIVSPGNATIITPKPGANSSVYEFRVFGLTSEAAVPLYSNVLGLDTGFRYLVLIVPSPESPKRMSVKFFGESSTAVAPEPSNARRGEKPLVP